MRFLKQTGHQTILSHSLDLLRDLNLEREEDEEKTRPIIFVGHSLGGLVVKQVRHTECRASVNADVDRRSLKRPNM